MAAPSIAPEHPRGTAYRIELVLGEHLTLDELTKSLRGLLEGTKCKLVYYRSDGGGRIELQIFCPDGTETKRDLCLDTLEKFKTNLTHCSATPVPPPTPPVRLS